MAIKNLTTAGATASYDEQIVRIYPTVAAMKADPGVANATWTQGTALAILLGSSAAFDQALKLYAWDAASTSAGNDTTIVQPTAITGGNAGRWRSPS